MKGGTIRRMANMFNKLMGRPTRNIYKDPVFADPRDRKKKRASGVSSGRFAIERKPRMARPPCEPGTITFHDKCVRYYGRKKADQIHSDWQHKDRLGNRDRLDRIPSLANFAAMRPWAWLNG